MDATTARGLRDEIKLSESRAALDAIRARVTAHDDDIRRRDLLRACDQKRRELDDVARAFKREPWEAGKPMPAWLRRWYHRRIWGAGRRSVLEELAHRIEQRHLDDPALPHLEQHIRIVRGHLGDG